MTTTGTPRRRAPWPCDRADDPSRTVGYGVPHTEIELAVRCARCRAEPGCPCTVRGRGRFHAVRQDQAVQLGQAEAFAEKNRRENAELDRDPHGPLWRCESNAPHPCGTPGVHLLAECTPLPAATSGSAPADRQHHREG